MSDYWLARAGQQYGPYSLEEIQQRVAQGLAEATDLIWTEGMAEWQPLPKVVPVRRGPPPPPLPPPAPKPIANYAAPPAAVDTGLSPPGLSWWLIIIFSCVTFGIFAWIWALKEAGFARKLDPRSSARTLMLLAVIGFIISSLLEIGVVAPGDSDVKSMFAIAFFLCYMASAILFIVAAFQIRRAMVIYYTTVEPIGLRMSGAMTFFFNVLYIQYHNDRIATWKRTGFLQPQV